VPTSLGVEAGGDVAGGLLDDCYVNLHCIEPFQPRRIEGSSLSSEDKLSGPAKQLQGVVQHRLGLIVHNEVRGAGRTMHGGASDQATNRHMGILQCSPVT
jgi:hypothetical protein